MGLNLILTANTNPVTVNGGGGGGSLTHGDSFTITGSGFGTRPDYNVGDYTWQGQRHIHYRFKDFEDGALVSQGMYTQYSDVAYTPPTAAMAVLNGGPGISTKYMTRAYSTPDPPGGLGSLSAALTVNPSVVFTSFAFMPAASYTSSGKFWRIWGDSAHNIWLSTGGGDYYLRGNAEGASGSVEWGNTKQFTPGTWSKVDLLLTVADTRMRGWMDGTLVLDKTGWTPASPNYSGHTIDYPNMIDGPGRDYPEGGSYNYDDIYLDFTPARVEIAAGGVSEVQILTGWSNTQITGVFRKGSLPSGAATLSVYDASNAVIYTQSVTVQ